MKVTLWGTRGSLASPGKDTIRYGGNTACVQVQGADGTVLILDAGTGIRSLGAALPPVSERLDILLTHLHLDHIQGLAFLPQLYRAEMKVHIWGPASATIDLRSRLSRYLAPPLFPVRLRDLPCKLVLHEVACAEFDIGEFRISPSLVCHPGPTVAFRLADCHRTLTYLPDHEPALGKSNANWDPKWTSGVSAAAGVDLLIHDTQYTDQEYEERVGWGHSSITHAFKFAALAGVKHLVSFHHDPTHDDSAIDEMMNRCMELTRPSFQVTAGKEGAVFELD